MIQNNASCNALHVERGLLHSNINIVYSKFQGPKWSYFVNFCCTGRSGPLLGSGPRGFSLASLIDDPALVKSRMSFPDKKRGGPARRGQMSAASTRSPPVHPVPHPTFSPNLHAYKSLRLICRQNEFTIICRSAATDSDSAILYSLFAKTRTSTGKNVGF